MRRGVFGFLAFALALNIPNLAAAHHPSKVERCENVTFTGRIERIEWTRPHVELFIRTDEGVTHEVSWLAINQLGLADIHLDTLQIGDEVTVVAGILPNDAAERPMLLSYIHRDSDGWEWSQPPEGC